MTLKQYRAHVRLTTMITEVVVEAADIFAARQQLEAQYGTASVTWGPVPA